MISIDTLILHLENLRTEAGRGDIPVDIKNLPELSYTTSEKPMRTFKVDMLNDAAWVERTFTDGTPQLQYLITFD